MPLNKNSGFQPCISGFWVCFGFFKFVLEIQTVNIFGYPLLLFYHSAQIENYTRPESFTHVYPNTTHLPVPLIQTLEHIWLSPERTFPLYSCIYVSGACVRCTVRVSTKPFSEWTQFIHFQFKHCWSSVVVVATLKYLGHYKWDGGIMDKAFTGKIY